MPPIMYFDDDESLRSYLSMLKEQNFQFLTDRLNVAIVYEEALVRTSSSEVFEIRRAKLVVISRMTRAFFDDYNIADNAEVLGSVKFIDLPEAQRQVYGQPFKNSDILFVQNQFPLSYGRFLVDTIDESAFYRIVATFSDFIAGFADDEHTSDILINRDGTQIDISVNQFFMVMGITGDLVNNASQSMLNGAVIAIIGEEGPVLSYLSDMLDRYGIRNLYLLQNIEDVVYRYWGVV